MIKFDCKIIKFFQANQVFYDFEFQPILTLETAIHLFILGVPLRKNCGSGCSFPLFIACQKRQYIKELHCHPSRGLEHKNKPKVFSNKKFLC
jgi:hypothetical protein